MPSITIERLKDRLLALDMEGALEAARSLAAAEADATVEEAIAAVSAALEVVGKRFQHGDWFLAELVYAGEIAREITNLLSPLMSAEAARSAGTVVIGTVAGDLHDLGKNIFISYARSAGFDVVDLGVDVSADSFVAAVREHSPLALGMSCLLTSTDAQIGRVLTALEAQGLRGNVRVIVGGAALTQDFASRAGADAFAADAISGIDIIRDWSAA